MIRSNSVSLSLLDRGILGKGNLRELHKKKCPMSFCSRSVVKNLLICFVSLWLTPRSANATLSMTKQDHLFCGLSRLALKIVVIARQDTYLNFLHPPLVHIIYNFVVVL